MKFQNTLNYSWGHVKQSLLKPFAKSSSKKGMTIIEILIVIAIMASLLAILARNFSDQADSAREDQARIAMGAIAQSLQLYKVHNNQYPQTAQGLEALVKDPGGSKRWRGPYLEEGKLLDPWGQKFDYQSDGRSFQMICGGKDQTIGTGDDIFYPEKQRQHLHLPQRNQLLLHKKSGDVLSWQIPLTPMRFRQS
jgi:general secretion pathway protein G